MKKVVSSLLVLSLGLSIAGSVSAAEITEQSANNVQSELTTLYDPYEPNDDISLNPYPINIGQSYTAEMSSSKDIDSFRFNVKPGKYNLALSNLANTDVDVGIIELEEFIPIGKSENSGSKAELIQFSVSEDATYTVIIANGRTGTTYPRPYTFKITKQ